MLDWGSRVLSLTNAYHVTRCVLHRLILIISGRQGMRTEVSALQLCAYRNHSVAAAWLLDVGGANLELQDNDGATPLLMTLMRSSVAVMWPFPLQRSQRIDASDHVEVRSVRYGWW